MLHHPPCPQDKGGVSRSSLDVPLLEGPNTLFGLSSLAAAVLHRDLFLFCPSVLEYTDFLGEKSSCKAFLLDYLWRLVMGNVAAGGLEQEPSEGREARDSVGGAPGTSDPTPTLQKKKQPAPPKLPMPPEDELEERFNVVLVSELHMQAGA